MLKDSLPDAIRLASGLLLFFLGFPFLKAHHGSATSTGSSRVRLIESSFALLGESAPGGWQGLRTDQAQAQLEQELLPYLSVYGRTGLRYRTWPGRPTELRQERDRLGSRLVLPFEEDWLLLGQVSVGLASGADRRRRVDQNFFDGSAEAGIGWRKERWLLALVLNGSFPLSSLRPGYYVEQWMIAELGALHPHEWLPDFQETVVQETFVLKKTTQWEGSLFYQTHPRLGLGISGLYRHPYGGLLLNRSTADRVPGIHREVSVLGSFTYSSLRLEIAYAYPLFRGRSLSEDDRLLYFLTGSRPPNPTEHRLYSHAWRFALYLRY